MIDKGRSRHGRRRGSGWVLEEGKRYCGATCHALRPCHELPAPGSHAGVTKIAGVGYEPRRLAATTAATKRGR